jgi:hypothetical protein
MKEPPIMFSVRRKIPNDTQDWGAQISVEAHGLQGKHSFSRLESPPSGVGDGSLPSANFPTSYSAPCSFFLVAAL